MPALVFFLRLPPIMNKNLILFNLINCKNLSGSPFKVRRPALLHGPALYETARAASCFPLESSGLKEVGSARAAGTAEYSRPVDFHCPAETYRAR